MKNKSIILPVLFITLIVLLASVGYLFDIIDKEIAFPIMFGGIGLQNIYRGIKVKEKRKWSLLFGLAMLGFTIIYVIPFYYLNWWH